ncbi:YopX family protein [Listeria monocytogenes]|nr:hypothetical protein [Listeria monocytogenes]EAE1498760.1 hypothetical protein [Listeria monocytogenes]HDI3721975.1 hypothetical protein [Listeria monocytogenes]HDU3385674.1 hypothetical protein [Listeria monocytogenes]
MKIEFRGKSKADGAWEYGFYHGNRHTPIIVNEEKTPDTFIQNRIPVDPKTVGQYTNVNTPRGEKIFEHDFVCVRSDVHMGGLTYPAKNFYGVVEFLEGMWVVNNRVNDMIQLWSETNEIEILGNIHDNPDWGLKEGAE